MIVAVQKPPHRVDTGRRLLLMYRRRAIHEVKLIGGGRDVLARWHESKAIDLKPSLSVSVTSSQYSLGDCLHTAIA
jgi:hypothetical protein